MNATELAQQIALSIDRTALAAAREKFRDCWEMKFFDVETYSVRAANKAFELGLNVGEPQFILDIGAGFGYFVLAARLLGHGATALEIPHDVIDAVYQAVPVPLVKHAVRANEPLPEVLDRFDLITIMGVNFEYPSRWWGEAEYRFLVNDLARRIKPEGQIHIEFNWGAETNFLKDMDWGLPAKTRGNVIRIENW